MFAHLHISIRNLLQSKRRTLLLGGALATVTLFFVCLLSLSSGLQDTLIRSSTTLSTGHINVAGFYKVTSSMGAPLVTKKDEIRKIVTENTPDLDYVIDRARGWSKVISEKASVQSALSGIDLKEEEHLIHSLQLAKESEYIEKGKDVVLGDINKIAEPNTAIMFAKQAKRLNVTVGDKVTIITENINGTTNAGDATIIAVVRDIGLLSSWTMFLSKETIRQLYQLQPDTSGAVMVYIKDINKAEKTMEHLRNVFAQKGYRVMDHVPQPFWMKFETVNGEDWVGQKLDLTVWQDEVAFLHWILTAINSISFFIIIILTIIIAIGITNTMYIVVRERTKEIGTMRAIGMQRKQVLIMILTEAFLLGAFSTLVGGIVGGIISYSIDKAQIFIPVEAVNFILMSNTLHLKTSVFDMIIAVTIFTIITAFASIWPAIRAYKMQPITAISQIQ